MKRALPRAGAEHGTRDRKVLEEELEYLGPVAIAMFVELGWIRLWPMSWSRIGLHALRNGYGQWIGNRQVLPIHTPEDPNSAAWWEHRRSRVPVGTNIPLQAAKEAA